MCVTGGGFSLHAAVRLEAEDRAGLERLLRCCARPAFASERLCWEGHEQPVSYALPKPLPSGQAEFTLTPLELLDRPAALALPCSHQRPAWPSPKSPATGLPATTAAPSRHACAHSAARKWPFELTIRGD